MTTGGILLEITGGILFIISNSVKVVVDDTGNAVSRMEYLPYGETWFQEGDENNSPKYNSQELDKETGYYFYNARHYDGEIGRFVTPDSVIDGEFDTQGWNRFAYCKGNPVIYRDPTGHETEQDSGGPRSEVANPLNTNSNLPSGVNNIGKAVGRGPQLIDEALKTYEDIDTGLTAGANEKQAITNIVIDKLKSALVNTKDMNQVKADSIINEVNNFKFPEPDKEPTLRATKSGKCPYYYEGNSLDFDPTNKLEPTKVVNKLMKPDLDSKENQAFVEDLVKSFFNGSKLEEFYKETKSIKESWSPISKEQIQALQSLQDYGMNKYIESEQGKKDLIKSEEN